MLGIPSNDGIFFELLSEEAEISSKGARELLTFINEPHSMELHFENLSKFKEESNTTFWTISEYTTKSFITPFHSEDILILAEDLNNLTINIVETGFDFFVYRLTQMTTAARELIQRLLKAVHLITSMFGSLKKNVSRNDFINSTTEIDRIAVETTPIFRHAVKNLFVIPKDELTVMKWNSIYNNLECSINSCRKLVSDMREIITKYD